jgi:phosphoglycolate phosphatase-like HAD superfamily hydrolase
VKPTVIFDFDGTLANSMDLIFRLYNEHAEQFGYEHLTWEEVPALRRAGYKKAMKIKKIRWSVLPKMILVMGKEMKAHMSEVEPYPKMANLLKELKQEGYAIGVLTSNQYPLVDAFLKKHNFPELDFLVSEKTLFGKDKALKRILRRHNLSKDNLVYVGDEPRDVAACNKIKVKVIGVTWGFAGEEGFGKQKADVFVASTSELKRAINRLVGIKQQM